LVQAPQLIARDIYQSFRMGARRIEVLRGISMDIAHNEAVFLSGASGAGKTPLLYTLAGLARAESGTVEFEGRRLYNGSSKQQSAIACALTNDTDNMFAGEPNGNLDSKSDDAMVDRRWQLARERNKRLLVVTHDTRLAAGGDRQLHIKVCVLQ